MAVLWQPTSRQNCWPGPLGAAISQTRGVVARTGMGARVLVQTPSAIVWREGMQLYPLGKHALIYSGGIQCMKWLI